jgi:hypothetical protein
MSSGGKRKRSRKPSAAAADEDEKRSKQSKVKGKSAADGQVEVAARFSSIHFLPCFTLTLYPDSFVS